MADQLGLASPEPADVTMEGHSQSTKIASLGLGHPQDFAALGQMDMNIPFPTGRHHPDSYGHGRLGGPLTMWYQRNDGPWTPPGLTSPQSNIRVPSVLGNLRASSLVYSGQYRESIVPSECDTVPPGVIPSDSGYGSYRAKHSVANGSVCDESLDRNTETQSLASHLGGLDFQAYSQDMVSKGGMSTVNHWPQSRPPPPLPSSSVPNHQANSVETRMCEICNKQMKTKSEFKKHKQRHDKPFKCDVEKCSRREGFSTPNDLDRHKRSLHPDQEAAGSRYRCPVGACKNKDKIWPRADNFRAHMKRIHQMDLKKDDNLDQYRSAPLASGTPGLTRDCAASESTPLVFPTEITGCALNSWELSRSSGIDISPELSPMEEDLNQMQVEETASLEDKPRDFHSLHVLNSGTSAAALALHSSSDDASFEKQEIPEPTSIIYRDISEEIKSQELRQSNKNDERLHPETPECESADEDTSPNYGKEIKPRDSSSDLPFGSVQPNKNPEEPSKIEEKAQVSPKPDSLDIGDAASPIVDLTNHNKILHLLEHLQNEGLLEKFGYKKEDPPEPEDAKPEQATSTTPEQRHSCSMCSKRFIRRCELKKHEKRHLKPYGCTYPGCDKKFGSKNDWKRHENSQHLMLEHWRCDEKRSSDPSDICGKAIHRRELFKQHLGTWHNIKDQAMLEMKLETCRIGRNCEARFWCGFCERIIEIKKEGIQAWTERFNHIDDHFHGRNGLVSKGISDWKNEFSPYRRAESPADDSEDPSVASSTPVSSAINSSIGGHNGIEKQHKRKRNDRNEALSSKRAATVEDVARFHLSVWRNHARDEQTVYQFPL
ncbi:hypothetical protein AAE478_006666 [Parahypoxylon ruwenzoriense]